MNGGSSAGADLLCCIRIVLYGESVPHCSWRSIVVKHPGPLKKRSLSSIYTTTMHGRIHCQSTPWPAADSQVGIASGLTLPLSLLSFRKHFCSGHFIPTVYMQCMTYHDDPQQTDKSADDPVIKRF